MFRKDEYIVCLNTPEKDCDFPPNYIYKQRNDEECLSVYLDNTGVVNGWSLIMYNGTGKYSEWRYATPEEVEHYDLLGKPYDVTTLPKFVLPEKWCVKDTASEKSNELYKYAGIHGAFPPYTPADYCVYYHFPKHDECTTSDVVEEGYTEITLAQFKTYVLGNVIVKEDYSYLIEFLTTKGIK